MKNRLFIVFLVLLNVSCQALEKENIFENHSDEIITKSTEFPRKLTRQEAEYLGKKFPDLVLNQITVIAPANSAYNCIAYSMGYTNQWINPPKSEREFAHLYLEHGYDLIYNGQYTIWGWGKDKDNMLHASVKKDHIAWASKLGAYICVVHPEKANFSSQYGEPRLRFFPMNIYKNQNVCQTLNENVTFREAQVIRQKCLSCDKKRCQDFDSLFNQWLENWKTNPETMFSNSTLDAKKLEEYPQLLAMGKEIIPLLMEKLLDESNFVGLVLYDDLQDNPDYKIVYDYEGTDWLEGEANRAKRTIKLWIKSLKHEEINKE